MDNSSSSVSGDGRADSPATTRSATQSTGVRNLRCMKKKSTYYVRRWQPHKISKLKFALRKFRNISEALKKLMSNSIFLMSDLEDEYGCALTGLAWLKSQFKNATGQNPKWTSEDNIFAAALYNRGPKSYRYLSKFVKMPSRSTIVKFLYSIPFEAGINKLMFDVLKMRVPKMLPIDRVVTLMFDEIPISPKLTYCSRADYILGFEDLGSLGRTQQFADTALVFMVHGLNHVGWKQPVAYFLSNGAVEAENLKVLITEVISNLQSAGLKIVCTVCDMNANHLRAIELLKNDSSTDEDSPFFFVDAQRVVVLFDSPHLLKATRNAFTKHAVRYDGTKTAKFEHLLMAFKNDNQHGEKRILANIRESYLHIDRYKRLKRKVSVAARTLSHKMAATIHLYAKMVPDKMPPEAIETAEFVKDINELFDSFNAGGIKRRGGYTPALRGVLARKSPHHRLWKDMLRKIETWEFLDEESGEVKTTLLCKKGWINNIRGVELIWKSCRIAGFDCLRTRMLNQEPVENLFSAMRLYASAIKNVSPTPFQLVSALKTSLVAENLANKYLLETDDNHIAHLLRIVTKLKSKLP